MQYLITQEEYDTLKTEPEKRMIKYMNAYNDLVNSIDKYEYCIHNGVHRSNCDECIFYVHCTRTKVYANPDDMWELEKNRNQAREEYDL